MDTTLYTVTLSDAHPGYQYVNLRRRPDLDDYVVVLVDVEKLINYSDQHLHADYVVSPAAEWPEIKRQELSAFLAPPGPTERHIEMPIVSFNETHVQFREPVLKLFSRKRERLLRWVGYISGSNRTRYFHFAGAIVLPVMCLESEAQNLQHYCGASA